MIRCMVYTLLTILTNTPVREPPHLLSLSHVWSPSRAHRAHPTSSFPTCILPHPVHLSWPRRTLRRCHPHLAPDTILPLLPVHMPQISSWLDHIPYPSFQLFRLCHRDPVSPHHAAKSSGPPTSGLPSRTSGHSRPHPGKLKGDHIPGKPPSLFRSHSLVACVWLIAVPSPSCSCGGTDAEEGRAVTISTVKTPPVEGRRATSPMAVENVERSSWANYKSRRGDHQCSGCR